MHVFGPTSFIYKKKNGTVTLTISNNFCSIISPSDELYFWGLSADAAYFKRRFPPRRMSRIAIYFTSFTFPDEVGTLKSKKLKIIKQAIGGIDKA